MSFRANVFYDKTIRDNRHILTKDKFNWVYCYGKKDLSIDSMLKNENNTFFFTSLKSLFINLFEKRLKSHFTKMEVHEVIKSVDSAYRDVVDMSMEMEEMTKGLITRGGDTDGDAKE